MLVVALVCLALVLLNGVFVAAEFGLVGSPRAALASRASAGDRLAGRVAALAGDARRVDRWIATSQLGITLASLGLGMYGEHALAEWIALRLEASLVSAHVLASVLAIGLLTVLHIVLGEMVPKSLALQSPVATSRLLVLPMELLTGALYPVVAALNGIGNGILRLVRHDAADEAEQAHAPADLAHLVRESAEEGLLAPGVSRVLQELFSFGELTAREVMVPRVSMAGLPWRAGVDEIVALLGARLHTRYPVWQGDRDHVAGVVTSKLLLRRVAKGEALQPADVRPVPFVPEAGSVAAVLATMRRERAPLVVVLDEFGGTAGIVTLEDLFAEVVGELAEGGSGTRAGRGESWRDGAGHLHVAGTLRLDELGEQLGRPLEHDEVDTVGGLVLALLGRPAAAGDAVRWKDVLLQVMAVERFAVKECIATPLEPAADEED